MTKSLLWVLMFCGALAAGGCTEKAASSGLVNVSGTVTIDGRPASGVRLLWIPTSPFERTLGDRSLGFAMTDQEGHFVVRTNGQPGAVVGRHFVIASKVDPTLLNQDPSKRSDEHDVKNEQMPTLASLEREDELLPSEFNRQSRLFVDIPPTGKQDANFDLWLINMPLTEKKE